MKQPITPYLTVKGAAQALEFYRKAFGASGIFTHPAEDGKRLMHASMRINGGVVMLSDEFPEHDRGERNADDNDGERDFPCILRQHRNVGDLRGQPRHQRRFAERTVENADQRDADLHGRKKTAWMIGQLQGCSCAPATVIGQVLQANPLRGHHRQFRHGENAIDKDKDQDN